MLVMSVAVVLPLRRLPGAEGVAPFLPFALYMLAILAPGILEMSRICEHWSARWIFQALPVGDPRLLLRGGIMALLFGTLLPVLLVAAGVLLAVSGISALPDVLLAAALVTWVILFAARRIELHIPFTAPMQAGEFNFTNIALVFGMLALAGLAAAGHAALRLLVPYGSWIGLALAVPLLVQAWRALDRVNLLDMDTGKPWKPPVKPPAVGALSAPRPRAP
jgi:hypothetical protein